MHIDVPMNGDTQHSGERPGARRAGRRPKENEVHRIVGATVGTEERRDRMRTGASRASKHLQWDYLGSASTMDRQPIEGCLWVSES